MVTRRAERTTPSASTTRDLDVVPPTEEVGHRVELARERIALGVGRVAATEGAAEITGAHRLQVVGQLVRERAGLHDGERAAGVADHVGIGSEVHAGVHRTGSRLFAEEARHLGRTDPAIAVPLGPPVAQPDAVHHAVPGEPVVRRRFGGRCRVGTVAQIAAAEGIGQLTGHGEVGRRDLFEHGRKVALQVRIGGDGHGCPLRSGENGHSNIGTIRPVNNG